MPETPYQEEIQSAIVVLSTAVLKRKGSELQEDATQLDSEVRDVFRIIGHGTMSEVWAALATQVVEMEKKPGMTVQRSPAITVTSLYGTVQVPSPYLWSQEEKRGCRPVSDHLGLRHHGRTPAVERALTDFVLWTGKPTIRGALRLQHRADYGAPGGRGSRPACRTIC